jgi:hypothetical protein
VPLPSSIAISDMDQKEENIFPVTRKLTMSLLFDNVSRAQDPTTVAGSNNNMKEEPPSTEFNIDGAEEDIELDTKNDHNQNPGEVHASEIGDSEFYQDEYPKNVDTRHEYQHEDHATFGRRGSGQNGHLVGDQHNYGEDERRPHGDDHHTHSSRAQFDSSRMFYDMDDEDDNADTGIVHITHKINDKHVNNPTKKRGDKSASAFNALLDYAYQEFKETLTEGSLSSNYDTPEVKTNEEHFHSDHMDDYVHYADEHDHDEAAGNVSIEEIYPIESSATMVVDPTAIIGDSKKSPSPAFFSTASLEEAELDETSRLMLLEVYHNEEYFTGDHELEPSPEPLTNEEIVKQKLRLEKQRSRDSAEKERTKRESEYQAVLANEEQQREERWKQKESARLARIKAKEAAEEESMRLLAEHSARRKEEEDKLIREEEDSFEELMKLRGKPALHIETNLTQKGEVRQNAKALEEAVSSQPADTIAAPKPAHASAAGMGDAHAALNNLFAGKKKATTIWDSDTPTPTPMTADVGPPSIKQQVQAEASRLLAQLSPFSQQQKGRPQTPYATALSTKDSTNSLFSFNSDDLNSRVNTPMTNMTSMTNMTGMTSVTNISPIPSAGIGMSTSMSMNSLGGASSVGGGASISGASGGGGGGPRDHNNHPMSRQRPPVNLHHCAFLLSGLPVTVNPLTTSSTPRSFTNSDMRMIIRGLVLPSLPLARRLRLWGFTEGFIFVAAKETDPVAFADACRPLDNAPTPQEQQLAMLLGNQPPSNKPNFYYIDPVMASISSSAFAAAGTVNRLKDWNELIDIIRDLEKHHNASAVDSVDVAKIKIIADMYLVPRPTPATAPGSSSKAVNKQPDEADTVPPLSKLCCEGMILDVNDDVDSLTFKVCLCDFTS